MYSEPAPDVLLTVRTADFENSLFFTWNELSTVYRKTHTHTHTQTGRDNGWMCSHS